MIQLDTSGRDYLAVLAGPPESVKMKSGLVVLAPGKSVGEHSIEQNGDSTVVVPESEMLGAARYGNLLNGFP